MTFQEEYRRFLEGHQVAYDERYVWDGDLYRPFRPGIASGFITQAVGLGGTITRPWRGEKMAKPQEAVVPTACLSTGPWYKGLYN